MQYGVYAQITDASFFSNAYEEERDENLKSRFNELINNNINQGIRGTSGIDPNSVIEEAFNISETVSGKYDINVKIPLFTIDSDVLREENDKIKQMYITKVLDIAENSQKHTVYNISYGAYINGDVLSLIIKCILKDGSNPQRIIMNTINYDMKNDKILTLEDAINIKGLKRNEVQDKINKEIKTVAEQLKEISSEYNIYKRNPNDDMYKIENTTEFFFGQDNILYILYPYGNNKFTSQMDIVIF